MFKRLVFLSCVLAVAVPALAEPACPRIVSQSPYITRALDWLGLAPCIVGVGRYDELDRPRTGGVNDPDADMIALLDPQLMITSDWTKPALWQDAAPKGATALRVGGFRGMAEVEAMLRDIGHAAGVDDIDARVARYAADWRAAATAVAGGGKRVLLLSACSAAPYSFGRGTTLYELFGHAGFEVVADHDGIRNFRADGPADELPNWLDARKPDLVFAFKNRRDEACNAKLFRPGLTILPIDGERFMRPGPDLVTALKNLRETLPR